MPSPTVSIVIAAYDAEESIERCVRSALGQTSTDLEVIVVDDGSSDRTCEVVEGLVAERDDGRLVVSSSASNEGPSAARNRGLDLARGEWVGFLDADDEYLPDFVDRMVAATGAEQSVDAVACAHRIVQRDGRTRSRPQGLPDGTVSGEDAALHALEFDLTHYVWDKLFRRELLGSAPFPAYVHRGEDLPVVLKSLIAARRVSIVSDALVVYYVSQTSLTWGRVATIVETQRLVAAVRDSVEVLWSERGGRHSVRVAESVIYLNAAHQAIARMPADEAVEYCRQAASRIPWDVAVRTVRSRPAEGAAELLLKSAPRLYRRAYRRYIFKAYAIAD